MKKLIIKPEGFPCALSECPPGHFLSMKHRDLCFKSEYSTDDKPEVFCSSGEAFWGGANSVEALRDIEVQPVIHEWVEDL